MISPGLNKLVGSFSEHLRQADLFMLALRVLTAKVRVLTGSSGLQTETTVIITNTTLVSLLIELALMYYHVIAIFYMKQTTYFWRVSLSSSAPF